MTRELSPFKIDIARNDPMDAYDVVLQVGGLKDRNEAQQFADALAEWMKGESGWAEKIQ